MSRPKKIKVFGTEIDVVELETTDANETYNHYTLEDGSVLKVKNVANSIVKVVGQTSPIGHPIYMVFTTPVVSVEHWQDSQTNDGAQR